MSYDLQPLLDKLAEKARLKPDPFLNAQTYFLAIESAYNMIIITDRKAIIKYANPAVERITGYTRNEALEKTPRLWGNQMPKDYYIKMWNTIKKGNVFNGEITNRRKNGDIYVAQITISPIKKNRDIIGFIGTEEDITIKRELQKEKEEFISMASHQLRTPLGSMKWNIELLREHPSDTKKELASLAKINQGMIDMVNKLLLVLKIRDNRLELHKDTIFVQEFIKDTINNFREAISEKNIRINLIQQEKPYKILADKTLLEEIINNLLDNAIRYSEKGKHILIKINKTGKKWSLQIRDNGIGIPKDELGKIFTKYYRAKNTVHITGNGLGLYIVNTYVQKMGGNIEVKSTPRKGTTITCTFPVEK